MDNGVRKTDPAGDSNLPPLPRVLTPAYGVKELSEMKLDPESIKLLNPELFLKLRYLRTGCYLVKMTSATTLLTIYDGTLRVDGHSGSRTASGDLYTRPLVKVYVPSPFPPKKMIRLMPGPDPDPSAGIPVFRRNRYVYYLSVSNLLQNYTLSSSFTLEFKMYRFDSAAKTWTMEGVYSAVMKWVAAPAGFPLPAHYLEGEVTNSLGEVVYKLSLGWISDYLRKATVEIDHVSASEVPLNNGAGVNWQTIYDQIRWQVSVYESNNNVTEPSGESWSDAELHQGMLNWRDSSNLDTEWRYHLLCVRRLDSTTRGIMYDAYGGDSNNIPREGAAISSHWMIPNTAEWGLVRNMRFGTATAPYFRTAVHEIGHAFMMFHPSSSTGNHIMQVTPQIAANAVPPVQFPNNIDWAFSPDDERRLKHLPDVVVRPGTVLRFGDDVGTAYSGIPVSPLDMEELAGDLQLTVTPLMETVPIGAPVRINIRLTNVGTVPLNAPAKLNFKTGHITGKVIDPSGVERPFATIVRYLDEDHLEALEAGKSLTDSLTLLRGQEGALFPSSGIFRVVVKITWEEDGIPSRVSGETRVLITQPVNEEHARAALRVLTTPDTLLSIAVGGDHLEEGQQALAAAMDNPELKPHFAFIEAKRLASRFGKRKANLKAAAQLLTDDTVMSPAEVKKAAKLIQGEEKENPVRKEMAGLLLSKAGQLDMTDDIKTMLA